MMRAGGRQKSLQQYNLDQQNVLFAYDERLDLLPILQLNELNGKSAGNESHDATHDAADGELGPDLGREAGRDRRPAHRNIDDEARHFRSLREGGERKRAPRSKARVRPMVTNLEILVPLDPIDLGLKHLALLLAGLDVHCQAE